MRREGLEPSRPSRSLATSRPAVYQFRHLRASRSLLQDKKSAGPESNPPAPKRPRCTAGCLPWRRPAENSPPLVSSSHHAQGGTRTLTPLSRPGVLSAVRLPIPPPARIAALSPLKISKCARRDSNPHAPAGAWRSERQPSTNFRHLRVPVPFSKGSPRGRDRTCPRRSAVGLQPTAPPLRRPAENSRHHSPPKKIDAQGGTRTLTPQSEPGHLKASRLPIPSPARASPFVLPLLRKIRGAGIEPARAEAPSVYSRLPHHRGVPRESLKTS
jgi:hypothetical protein